MAERTDVPVRAGERRSRRRDPLEVVEDLPAEVARLWGQAWPLMPWPLRRPLHRLAQLSTAWAPSLDAYEQAGELVVQVDLPGVRREDVEVLVDEGDLVVQGERRADDTVKDEDYHRVERPVGNFHRRLALPFEAQPEQIRASFEGGVLDIRIPKPTEEPTRPHRIPIG